MARPDPHAAFAAATRDWFGRAFAAPTPAQELGWPAIASGEHVLIQAPTGSGKTLAAFLSAIDRLSAHPGEGLRPRQKRVYRLSRRRALTTAARRHCGGRVGRISRWLHGAAPATRTSGAPRREPTRGRIQDFELSHARAQRVRRPRQPIGGTTDGPGWPFDHAPIRVQLGRRRHRRRRHGASPGFPLGDDAVYARLCPRPSALHEAVTTPCVSWINSVFTPF